MISTDSVLTVTSHFDRSNRRIILLHSDVLAHFTPTSQSVNAYASSIPPNDSLVLIYLHAGLAVSQNPSLWNVRSFRYAYESLVPSSLRARIQQILPVHVSVVTRGHIYMSSFSLEHSEFSKIQYCDLIADMERIVGVDATLLGLRNIDFEYDEEMRHWVGRHHEVVTEQKKTLDPSKPLLNTADISFSTMPEALTETPSQPSFEP